MADAVPDFTPVHVLTGFLGSGKTTLLSRLLRDPDLADTAVLINEFGEIGLDHHLLERIDETMVLLTSGCLCCTVRGELSDAIKRLLSQRERGLVPAFRRLVIETTGLADPLPVLSTLAADPVLRHHVRVGSVITTVDAVNGTDQLRRQPESLNQAAVADTLVLTKTDLAGEAAIAAVLETLGALNPDARLLRAAEDDLGAAHLLADHPAPVRSGWNRMRCQPVNEGPGAADDRPEATAGHTLSVEAFWLEIDQPLDWTGFAVWLSMLLHRHGGSVLRVKGILNVEGSPTPVAIHGVQQLVHAPRHLDAWPDGDRRSRIVFIVRGLDPALVRRSLRAFGILSDTLGAAAA